ncbi:MAG TPA: hypothetical protein VE420_08150 [Gemmatimonadales bacterium]|nr:hypothetical protein [Gemmatimonadales bacterium]
MLELFTPRRIAVTDVRIRSSVARPWPSWREQFESPRYRTRARRLTPEQELAIRVLAGTKSLRSLAAEFGVSHETIRAVVRHGRSPTGCALRGEAG